MIKILGVVMKNSKIIDEEMVVSSDKGKYQEKLKECIIEICYRLDIEKPYWLPRNMKEYNKRSKTYFNKDNFVDEINFDKFIIEEINID